MALKNYDRHSAAVIRSPRWKVVRLAVKRRDNFCCVKCGKAGQQLEVDHIKPVREAPELAFEMSNLQSLCKSCHSAKTKIECGFGNELSPDRAAWRELLRQGAPQTKEKSCLPQ
jgi:5-methylcytosine-specific restriction endonuclease McrA